MQLKWPQNYQKVEAILDFWPIRKVCTLETFWPILLLKGGHVSERSKQLPCVKAPCPTQVLGMGHLNWGNRQYALYNKSRKSRIYVNKFINGV